MDIARRRGCNAQQQTLLVWLYAALGYQPGTISVTPQDAIKSEVCSSESSFGRALKGLESLGLVQVAGRSAERGKILHVLRTYQPELQQYIEWPDEQAAESETGGSLGLGLRTAEDPTSPENEFSKNFDHQPPPPAAAAAVKPAWPPNGRVADSASSRDAGAYEQSTSRGTEVANIRLPSTPTLLDVPRALEGENRGRHSVASGPEAAVRPSEAGHRGREAVAGARAPDRASVGTQNRGPVPIGAALPELSRMMPSRRNLAAFAAGICEQLRALGDPNPTSSQTKGFAWKVAMLMHMGESIVNEINDLYRQAQGKAVPYRWFCSSCKKKFGERGMWDELTTRKRR